MLNHTELKQRAPFLKSILILDDDPDIVLTFKEGLEAENSKKIQNDNVFFEVFAYDDPIVALSKFKPNFYDLLLIDINMPKMNGIDLSIKILELDNNVKICFITAGDANIEVLRELYPTRSIGCYIKKPVTIDQLVSRIKAELE